jgi:hypothetical protein
LEDKIIKALKEIGGEGMDWIDLAQNRDSRGGFSECGNETSGSIKFGEFHD